MSSRLSPMPWAYAAAWAVLVTVAPAAAQTPAQQQAKARELQAQALLAKYSVAPGREDSDALFKESAVRAELQRVVGKQLPRLMKNLEVRGPVDVIGGALSVSGNAAHKGGEEGAVVCVNPWGPQIDAAIYSRGKVTLFSGAERYTYTSTCVRDWITVANTQYRDRMSQPKNVQFLRAK
jgi:hypothetical protein